MISAIILPFSSLLWADQEPGESAQEEQQEAQPDATRPPYARGGAAERRKFEEPKTATIPQRREEAITFSPSSVTVITGTDLRERFGVRFLSDALRIVPGLEVMRSTSTESNVNVRGYNDLATSSQGIMALIDGRQVYNEFLGNVLWESLPVTMDEIDRIEVIRGPGSFLYGPNAMHGLVHIVTKSPLDYEKDVIRFSGGYGSYESSVASLMYVRRGESTGFKATLGWDDVRQFDESPSQNVGDKKFAEVRFEKRIAQDHHIELTVGILEQIQELSLIQPILPVPPAKIRNELQESFVKGNYTVGDLKAQVSWTGTDATLTPDQFYAPFELDLDTVDIDLQYSVEPLIDHNVTFGTGYRHATFNTEDQDVSNGRHSTNLEWVFLQDELKLADNLFVTGGLRLDFHSVTGTNPSPRIAAVWKFDEERDDQDHILREQSLRASAGYGFRNPSLRELWFDIPVTLPGVGTVTILGNKDLEAEKIRSFELGYFGRPLERVKAAVSVYYNLIDDLIEYQVNPVNPLEAAPSNENDEEAYGVETEVDYLFSDSISGFVNYSYGIRRDRDTFQRVLRTPLNKANAGVRVSTPTGFSGMLWVNYFGDTEFGGTALDDYALLNAQISYTFPVDQTEARVYLQAFNLLDERHREHPLAQSYGLILMAGLSLLW
ncbi:MAG: TonB-dependent receptor [Planctomycetota bacterium]|nr:TonB-dependent receptor [Planctomycetota bacterium]